MPYNVTGCDSTGERHDYVMDDTGAVTGASPGADVLSAWLADNPYEKPEPIEGEPPPEPGELTASQMEALRQHVSKLLTVVQIAPAPAPEGLASRAQPAPDGPGREPARGAPPTPTHHTTAELEAMTVTDLRSLAVAAQIAGASTMNKAELVSGLQAHERSRSER